jgi:Kef-type K+ transport system membrane component KefB
MSDPITFHPTHLNLLLIVGIAIFGGTLGARLFKRLRIPQVVGYVAIGLVLGQSGIKLFDQNLVEALRPFNYFALGLIGFMIGGELRLEIFRKYGRQLMIILLAEGIAAFLAVGLLVTGATWFFTHDIRQAIALGTVLGAIASATAPAATVDVLWETRSGGPLTTTVLAIVALDDGLALLLYAFAASVADGLIGDGSAGWMKAVLGPIYELGGAVLLGVAAGVLLNFLIRRIKEKGSSLAFTIGLVFVIIGLTLMLKINMILSAMCVGMTVANLAPRRSRSAFELVESFAPPIYTLFFVLVGARLTLSNMTLWTSVLAVVYVIGRTGGKMLGARFGARWGGAADTVRRYLGLCLFSQAGVAIGLAILASQHFPSEMGQTIIIVITGTTLIVQLLGPPSVRYAVERAGEAGMNITVEDLIASYRVGDVMEKEPVLLHEETPLAEVIRVFSDHNFLSYPVVDEEKRLKGIITFQQIRRTLANATLLPLLVADDVLERPVALATADMPLPEAMELMNEVNADHLAVVSSPDDRLLTGYLDRAVVMHTITTEVLRRTEKSRAHLE